MTLLTINHWAFQGWNHPLRDVIDAPNPKGVSCSIKWCRKSKQSPDQGHLLEKTVSNDFLYTPALRSNGNKWEPRGFDSEVIYKISIKIDKVNDLFALSTKYFLSKRPLLQICVQDCLTLIRVCCWTVICHVFNLFNYPFTKFTFSFKIRLWPWKRSVEGTICAQGYIFVAVLKLLKKLQIKIVNISYHQPPWATG